MYTGLGPGPKNGPGPKGLNLWEAMENYQFANTPDEFWEGDWVKFLVDRDGYVVTRFDGRDTPKMIKYHCINLLKYDKVKYKPVELSYAPTAENRKEWLKV